MSFKYIFKFILIGDSGIFYGMMMMILSVGKSCLLHQFINQNYHGLHDVTLGVEFRSKSITIEDIQIKLQIWDTAGQEHFKSLTRSYYRGACCALLLFDITRRETFDHVNNWVQEAKTWGSKNLVIMLVGNKLDLQEKRAVSYEEGKEYADREGIVFIETSAKTSDFVEEAFFQTASAVYEKIKKGTIDSRDETNGITIASSPQIKNRNCCSW